MSVAEPPTAGAVTTAEQADGRPDLLARSLRVRQRVLRGGRIDFVSPHLTEGQVVEVDVRLPGELAATNPPRPSEAGRENFDLMAWLDALPPTTRTPEEWEEWEREFQQERDSWGR